MSKLTRYEFLGSWITFWVFCVTIVLIPMAILYLINRTVVVNEEIEDPQAFINAYRNRKV
jgi:hypothetical protein